MDEPKRKDIFRRESISFHKENLEKRRELTSPTSPKSELTSLLKIPHVSPMSETELDIYVEVPRSGVVSGFYGDGDGDGDGDEALESTGIRHFVPNPNKVPAKSIMKKNSDRETFEKGPEDSAKTVRWIDDNETPEPLHTEYHIPHWDRKSPFLQTSLWKSVVARDNLKKQKLCVWVVVCVIATICLGFIIILLLILKFVRPAPDTPPEPPPAPALLKYKSMNG